MWESFWWVPVVHLFSFLLLCCCASLCSHFRFVMSGYSFRFVFTSSCLSYLPYLCLFPYSGGLFCCRLECPMLPVSLDCPYSISPSVFSYVYIAVKLLFDTEQLLMGYIFMSLYNYEFWLSLCKIVRSSVILLLPLYIIYVVKYGKMGPLSFIYGWL
jgi:hypothetical protein